ncbi:GNAT family N-acetyltransferase [Chachezhania sediminis]|uniref:GNAT family N-acetyltransferase n=1 Tax=Chachezhania sediminis TaxID=2599291 RepID=UPI001E2ECEE4|nr:GNAT family N-acetyltransferase [Chachezhania sediminis]
MTGTLRPARPLDAGVLGDILHDFQARTPWMPKLYSGAETVAFCGTLIDRGWVRVAEREGVPAGFIARDGAEICALYITDAARRQGHGAALLADAKGRQDRLWLRCFQVNAGAQAFYRAQGFRQAGTGDGTGNEEGLPDFLYEWQAEDAR